MIEVYLVISQLIDNPQDKDIIKQLDMLMANADREEVEGVS